MKTLLTKVSRQRLFIPGETVVVAVSGGADSVALLDILVHLQAERLNLVVAHLNHGLRGEASDGDERFVSELAARYGLPFVARRADVAALAHSSRLSLEDAGRRARYAFFAETANAHGATSIALAHHRDDQAETVLIRLLRGAGGAGLSSMTRSAGMLKRPLLQISRAELEQYLNVRGISHRTDESNSDTAILRNSIRHELIPFLKRYNPKVSERLAATAEILASDQEILDQLTESAFSRVAECRSGAVSLKIEPLSLESRGLRLRLYRRALMELRGDLQRIALSHLDAIDAVVTSERPNAQLKLPGECFVTRSYGDLEFRVIDDSADTRWEVAVEGEGRFSLPTGATLEVQRVPRPAELYSTSPLIAFIEPAAAPFPWTVRTFQPGDRFIPLGMQGAQKVKDLFINKKVPLRERRRIPIIVSDGRIIWVAGVRVSEEVRITAAAQEVLRVEIQNP